MKALTLLTFVFVRAAAATQAQPVPVPGDQSLTPQVEIAGAGAATLSATKFTGAGAEPSRSAIDFSDSALFVGAAQRLSNGSAIGSSGLGWLTLDGTNEGLSTPLFLNQAFLDFQDERYEILIGRTDNPSAHLIDFPTTRGDDLIDFLNPLNPFSNGKNSEEHRYANVASVTFNQSLRTFENFHVQHLIDSAGIGTPTGIHSFGANFEYLGTPGMEPFQTVPTFGLGYEGFTAPVGRGKNLHQIYAGGTLNLNASVTHRWTLEAQDIAVIGGETRDFKLLNDTYRAGSNVVAAALRYLDSPFGAFGYQIALTGAYKTFFRVRDARSFAFALNGVRRLGSGFSLVAQYSLEHWGPAIAGVREDSGTNEHVAQLGFVFSFDSVINQHLSPRRSLINQQFQYVPN